VGSDISN